MSAMQARHREAHASSPHKRDHRGTTPFPAFDTRKLVRLSVSLELPEVFDTAGFVAVKDNCRKSKGEELFSFS